MGECEGSNSLNKEERYYRRHAPHIIARLEAFFEECPHPNENQRRQIGEELGLEARQIKFWFQNKRTQVKTQNERLDNNALRLENEKVQSENHLMRETLKGAYCASCGGRALGEEERELHLQTLRLENLLLAQEYERVSKVLASHTGINSFLLPTLSSSSRGGLQNQRLEIGALEQHIPILGQHILAPEQRIPILDQRIPAPVQCIPFLDQRIPILDQRIHAPEQCIPFLDQHIPAPNQHIPIIDQHTPATNQGLPTLDQLIPALNQHIPVNDQNIPVATLDENFPALTPGLNQYISAPAPALDQHIPTPTTPSINQNSPALNIDQDIPLISSLDHNIPAMITALDHNIAITNSAYDQNNNNNITVVQQGIKAPNHGVIPALNQNIPPLGVDDKLPALDLDLYADVGILNNDTLPQAMMGTSTEMEKVLMAEIANTAMEELVKLLNMNEPFWFRSLTDGKFILQRDSYNKIFSRSNRLKGPHARVESSKDSRVVNMDGIQLVEMIMDSDKWADLFPSIVRRAQTIQIIESGSFGNRNGALQLMNAEMHILSPLVPSREFVFLRYCKKIEVGTWVIADISFDSPRCKTIVPHSWRLPSGCLIQEMTEGLCRVSWVEHVEVDDKVQTHRLFRDVICGKTAYGAERWVLTLERMCERYACASAETLPSSDMGVIRLPGGRKSLMQLAQRMVKVFCGILKMEDNMDFPHLNKSNKGEVRISVRNNTESGVPSGMIVSAATSFWLPLPPQTVFDFLTDSRKRAEWDVLLYGNPGHQIQRIAIGPNPGNCTSIIRPLVPRENKTLILQESCVDSLGSMLVYTPFDMETISLAMKRGDTSPLAVLPSGFTISWDGNSNAVEGPSGYVGKSGGSLVTLAYQLVASGRYSATGHIDTESVGAINTLVASTVEKIKSALNCPNVE